ncbi:cytochrome P450 [Russula emetica]|nr:cytochrome P450 [Russula emetica]
MIDIYPPLPSFQQGVWITVIGLPFYALVRVIYNIYFHPLSRFPGPRGAACTGWWLAYMELGRGISLSTLREELHKKYGDIVRIAPNELHFAKPTAYNEIYNSQNKWDKDYKFYRVFDSDESFMAQSDYLKAKHKRALISNMFSKRAISEIQHLIRGEVRSEYPICECKSSNLYLGFQCFAADTICNFLFATSFDQLSAPDFQGELVKGIDKCMPSLTIAKFFPVYLWIIRYFPASILIYLDPTLKAVMGCKNSIEAQVKSVLQNPKLLDRAPHPVIYNAFLNPEANKGHHSPTALSISHDTQVLFSAGSHTVGTTLMTGAHYLLRNPEVKQRLVDELRTAWPVLDQAPSHEELEKLPFLASAMGQTAVIKEALRIAVPVPVGLARIVPPSGAIISGVKIPGGTVVSQSHRFVSFSEEIFTRAHEFIPDRWLQPESKTLGNWLVVFSKGPRGCLGINLAYCELYLTFAYLFRRFDVREDPTKPADLTWSEHYLPLFEGQHLLAYCDPRSD